MLTVIVWLQCEKERLVVEIMEKNGSVEASRQEAEEARRQLEAMDGKLLQLDRELCCFKQESSAREAMLGEEVACLRTELRAAKEEVERGHIELQEAVDEVQAKEVRLYGIFIPLPLLLVLPSCCPFFFGCPSAPWGHHVISDLQTVAGKLQRV